MQQDLLHIRSLVGNFDMLAGQEETEEAKGADQSKDSEDPAESKRSFQ